MQAEFAVSVRLLMFRQAQQVRQLLGLFKSRRVGAAVSLGVRRSRGYSFPDGLAVLPARIFWGAVAVLPWLAARAGWPGVGVVLVSHALSMRVFWPQSKAVRVPRVLAWRPV